MPAAAVIPAPIAYIKVVAVKKLVVGFLDGATGPLLCSVYSCLTLFILAGKRISAFSCRGGELHLLL